MHQRRIAPGRAVEDAFPRQAVEALTSQAPPRYPGGEDDRLRPQDIAAVEMHLAALRVQPRDRTRDDDLGSQPPGLLQRSARQLVARHAGGEAEVVLDP